MSRYTGPRIKIIRRLGLLPGLTQKFSNRINTPGQHGVDLSRTPQQPLLRNEYTFRLFQRQRLRFHYGVTERQLISYYQEAKRCQGSTGNLLLEFLESRFDSTIFRLGFAPTIPAARQLINHGHFKINGKRVTIPSFLCQPGDKISLKENSKVKPQVQIFFNNIQERRNGILKRMEEVRRTDIKVSVLIPNHLSVDPATLTAKVIGRVQRNDIPIFINELKVVEYYSR